MKDKYQEALDNVKRVYRESEHYDEQDIATLQELVDLATPKKPITIKPTGDSIWDYPTDRIKCPNCSVQLPMKKNCLAKKKPILFCDRCGQRLDWSDEE